MKYKIPRYDEVDIVTGSIASFMIFEIADEDVVGNVVEIGEACMAVILGFNSINKGVI